MADPASSVITIQVDQAVPRLDQYLAEAMPHLSRSQLKKLIKQQNVLVAGQPAKPSSSLEPGDRVSITLPPPPAVPYPQPLPLDVIFEDEALLVVNKPAGMVVHPGHGHRQGTLVNALLARYPELQTLANAPARPGIVHRLDQDTSGLLVVARTAEALQALRRQFKQRTVKKTYLALVDGLPDAPAGLIDVPLGRDPRHRQKFAPRPDGKAARTGYRVVETFEWHSLLEIDLETGRTHQIRVHLAWLGYPVVGDEVYGRRKTTLPLSRQFLHAWRLGLTHPLTGAWQTFEAPLPEELATALAAL